VFEADKKQLGSYALEKYLAEALEGYLQTLKFLGVSEPVSLALSVIGIKGWTLQIYTPRYGGPDPVAFREEDLLVPEGRIDSFELEAHSILRPAFDRIWNAAGRNSSAYYSEDGEWIADKPR
jgi:hypothetical protein